MKEIIFKNNDSEIKVDANLSYYLYSKLFIFFLKDDDALTSYILSQNEVLDLNNVLEKYLIEILEKWYKEPNEKEFQKYSSRYEKIKFNLKTYKVNYRMSEIARLVFIIDNILNMFNRCIINNEKLNIKFKEI